MKTILKVFIGVFSPLLIGGVIYYLTRSNTIYFLNWIDRISPFERPQMTFSETITYNLPDGLWSFALTNLLLIIWGCEINKKTCFWLIISLLIGVSFELFYGTFDYKDLFFILAGAIIPIFLTYKFKLIKTIYYESKK